MNNLILWDKARLAIEEARTIDEVKDIRDRAEAFRMYAKQAHESLEVQNKVAEIKLRCERKIGEMIPEQTEHGGDRKTESSQHHVRLKDIGISEMQSSRYQAIAQLPEEQFEEHIAQVQASNEELTTVGLVRFAKSLDKKEEIQTLKEQGVILPQGKYATLVIDPPWEMQKIERDVRPNQSEFEYPTMNEEQLKAFDVPSFTENDAHLYLWTTHKHLPLALRLAEHWGFKYQCLMTWVKNVGFTPFSWMYSTEHVLFCTKGSLPLLRKGLRLDFQAKVREHSRKPDEFYELVKQASPGPRIDVFSREKRDGFYQYGNEPGKFIQ